jgi:hypothetical protein
MSNQDKQLPGDQQTLIEDLTVGEDQSVEVKAGEQLRSGMIVVMVDGSVRWQTSRFADDQDDSFRHPISP